MKVLLVCLNSKYVHTNIALLYLKNRIKDVCDVEFLNLNINESIVQNIATIASFSPDIVCFGTYIWNVEQTLKIASSLYKINPSIILSLGGPEVSYHAQEMLDSYPFITTIQCGESENNILTFIDDAKKGTVKSIYSIAVSTEDIPSIAQDLVDYYDGRPVYFETSRGCPYRCSYCLSCIDKSVKFFDLERVLSDLKLLLDKNVMQIRFIDRTFNADRKRALAIWKFLLDYRKDTTFHFEICASLIDEETLLFLKTIPPNVFRFEIGMQSTNAKTLEAIHRNYLVPTEISVIQKLVHQTNIFVHTDLIIGLPYETIESFKASFNDIYSLHTSELQLGFLKLLRGSDIYCQTQEHGYHFHDFPPYEVISNRWINAQQLFFLKQFEQVFEWLNNSGMFATSLRYLDTKFQNGFLLYEKIAKELANMKRFSQSFSYEQLYRDLLVLFPDDIVLVQTLTYDYISKNKGSRPWMYQQDDLLKEINLYISTHPFFIKLAHRDIMKNYRFVVLDIDINSFEEGKRIYYFKK